MHVRIQLVLNKHAMSRSAFERVLAIAYADGRYRSTFSIDLPSMDPRMLDILHIVAAEFVTPLESLAHAAQPRSGFTYKRYRAYNHDDWNCCELLRMDPLSHAYPSSDEVGAIDRTNDGFARLAVEEIPMRVDFLRAYGLPAAVPQRVRSLLDRAGLESVVFRPTCPVRVVDAIDPVADCTWSEFPEPWWELTSNLVLPPVSPSMKVSYASGSSTSRGSPDTCGISDGSGFHGLPELRYLRTEIEALGYFDLAHVFERSSSSMFDRALVASRRFYKTCCENNLGVNWIPVHIEDDM